MSQEKLLLLARRVNNAPGLLESLSDTDLEQIGVELEQMFPPKATGFIATVVGTSDHILRELKGKVSKELKKRDEIRKPDNDRNDQKPDEQEGTSNQNSNVFTTSRQVLAIYYLLSEAGLDWNTTNKTDIARFSQFLTGKEAGNKKIENTSLYKKWKELYSDNERKNRQDLEYVKNHFEQMGLHKLASKVQNDMDNE